MVLAAVVGTVVDYIVDLCCRADGVFVVVAKKKKKRRDGNRNDERNETKIFIESQCE